jgi:cytoskeletal protein RodZ
MGDHSLDVAPHADLPPAAVSAILHPAVGPGELLRRTREQRGLTLQQIATTTKIPTRHLEALERDDFGVVPGGMYLRAEIRAYADAVGLSRDVALGYLHAAVEPPPVVAVPPAAAPSAPVRRRSPRGAAVIGVCVAAIALIVLWATVRGHRAVAASPAVSQTRTAPVQPVTVAAGRESTVARASERQAPSAAAAEVVTATSGRTTADAAVASLKRVTAPPVRDASSRPVTPELDIVTAPAGARVTVDGVGWGMTPVSIRYLPPGRKRLRVTRDGFAAQEQVIDFSSDRPRTTVRLTLHPLD